MIAATGTWLAYNSTPFAVTPPELHYNWDIGGITNSPGNPPAKSMYRDHAAGQPAYQIGVHMPWPDAGPYVLYSAASVGYSHLMARNGSPWSGWRRAVTSTTWWATWTSTRIRNCWTPTRWW